MFFLFKVLLIFNFLIFYSFSQNSFYLERDKAKNQLNKKGEVYFRFVLDNKNELKRISKIISIDNVKGDTIYAYANEKEFINFLSLDIPFKVLPHPGDVEVKMWDGKGIWNFDSYPTYEQYEQIMLSFSQNYPNLCKLDTIAILLSGRKLLMCILTSFQTVTTPKPKVLLIGTIHGDETAGYVLLLRLINYLLTNYSTNQEVKMLLDSIEIHICPLANPDGTYNGGNNTVSGATRYNSNNVDLNRNFPDPKGGNHPDGNPWQQETIALMNYTRNKNFVISFNTHGGAEVFNFPWDTWTSAENAHADSNWFYVVGREFADTAQYYGPPGYFNDLNNGVTAGGDWYVIEGGLQDFMNYFRFSKSVTLELSAVKLLPENELTNYWNYLHRSFINFIKHSLYGIRGIITDACANIPIKAKVFINNYDKDNSFVFSDSLYGNYHRPLLPGIYNIIFSAPGYMPFDTTVSISSLYSTKHLNIKLQPNPPIANFDYEIIDECSGIVKFINTSLAPSSTTYIWYFNENVSSTEINPIFQYTQPGIYEVKLIASNNCTGNDTIVKQITIDIPTFYGVLSDTTVCISQQTNIIVSSNAITYWYDDSLSNTPIYIGDTLSVIPDSNLNTYYVEVHKQFPPLYGGNDQIDINGGYYTYNYKHYLIFNCYKPVKLVSVEVNAFNSGYRTIELLDSANNILNTAYVYIPQGIHRITLNFDLPVANGLKLVGPPSPYLYRNNTGTSYPYNIGNYISIIGNSANDLNYYYYFYNWEIKPYDCISQRIPINVYAYESPNVEMVHLTTNEQFQATICAEVIGGSGFYLLNWNPLNLIESQQENCIVTVPLSPNINYSFSVNVVDEISSCTIQDSLNIILTAHKIVKPKLNVFFNNNQLFIESEISFMYIITDVTGKIIMSGYSTKNEKKFELNIDHLRKGIYNLIINTSKQNYVYKIVKF